MRRIGRILFSRYTVSASVIILEVFGIIYLLLRASTYSYIAFALAMAVDVAMLFAVINMDANPEYKVSWLLVVTALPIAGAVLYAMFYRRRLSRREARLLRGTHRELGSYREGDASAELSAGNAGAAGISAAIGHDDPLSLVYGDTSAEYFPSGEEYFDSLLRDLRSAERFIFLEYFIIERGALWDSIHEVLREKAAVGVDVRVIYDDLGCMGKLPTHYEQTLRFEGISCLRFNKLRPIASIVHNNRNHRKVCIVDGRVCYTGGVNIADEYVNLKSPFGHWKDGGIRLSGSAVAGFLRSFLSIWDLTARTVSDYEHLLSAVSPSECADGGYYMPFGSGPYPIYKRPSGKNALLNIINRADRYVYITTPYLVIDHDLTEALCNAAARGVDVRIITPAVADKRIVKIMTKSSYPRLMESGVGIYEYAPGFIHEKSLVCDDSYAIVGTINLDYRSLMHNFECAVWIYASPTVAEVKAAFEQTLTSCTQMNGRIARLTLFEWLVRCGVRIFAPLM